MRAEIIPDFFIRSTTQGGGAQRSRTGEIGIINRCGRTGLIISLIIGFLARQDGNQNDNRPQFCRSYYRGVFAQVCIDWVTSDLTCAEHDLSGRQVPGSGNILGPCLTSGESASNHGLAWLQSLPSRVPRCPQHIALGFHGHGRRVPFTGFCHFPRSDTIAMQEQ